MPNPGDALSQIGTMVVSVPMGSGNAAAFPSHNCRTVTIKSRLNENTDDVWIGNSSDGQLYPLSPGEYLSLDVQNTDYFYCYSAVANQKLRVIYGHLPI